MSLSGRQPDPLPRKWILTTCQGRLHHLQQALPSWLDCLPDWQPIVVCMNDPTAILWVLSVQKERCCVPVVASAEWPEFNRTEAIRAGLRAMRVNGVADDAMVAILDADLIARNGMDVVLSRIEQHEFGVALSPVQDDMGFLVASLEVLSFALDAVPVGSFGGYGYEDNAIRAGCWVATSGSMVRVPLRWTHIQHNLTSRNINFVGGLSERQNRGRANRAALVEVVRSLVPDARVRKACWQAIMPQGEIDRGGLV
jgi:hypothetical protein